MASITRSICPFRVQSDLDSVAITFEGSTSYLTPDITKIAKGVLGGLAQIPVINFIGEKICEVMTHFNFDMTDTQEAIQILLWIEGIQFTVLRMAALAALTFYIVILGPIIEEVVFRGFVNPWVRGKLEENGYDVTHNSLHKALYWTLCGMAFGAVHFSTSQGWMNVPIIVATGLMGVTFSILRDEETSDITAPTVAHITNNGLAFTNYFLTPKG